MKQRTVKTEAALKETTGSERFDDELLAVII